MTLLIIRDLSVVNLSIYFQQLADKDQSLLDERIKRAMRSRPVSATATITKPPTSSRLPVGSAPPVAKGSPPEPVDVSPTPSTDASPVRPNQSPNNTAVLQNHNLNNTVNFPNDDAIRLQNYAADNFESARLVFYPFIR